MRYILAATGDKAAAGVIRSAFRRPFQVDRATTVREGLESFRNDGTSLPFSIWSCSTGSGESATMPPRPCGPSGNCFRRLKSS